MTTAEYREVPSQGKLAGRYYSGGEIRRPAAPQIHESSTLAPFRMIKAEEVRAAQGETTAAMELTFRIEGAKAAQIAAQLQPGLFFAFEPKNNKETVDAILDALKPSPQQRADGRITVPVKSAYMMTNDEQTLPKRDVLAGLVDVSRPTEQLVNLLALRAKEAGKPLPETHDAAKLAACYTVAELLQYRPGLLTLEDVYANQPPMMARPYTISDYDRKNHTVSLLISGVSAKLAEGDPLGIKGEEKARTKDDGNASGMLLDIATAGDNGGPDKDFLLNGYVLTRIPHLMFPGLVEKTDAVQSLMDADQRIEQHVREFEQSRPDQTLYFLATGSGMAPFMSALREMSRRQKAKPDHEKPFAGKIVLINGGRYEQDELFADECRRFVKDGLVETYHAAASSTGKEKVVTLKDGQLHETETQGKTADGGRYYIQDVLESSYGKQMDADIRAGRATVYVCGTQGALRGTFSKWPDAFRTSKNALQHTASVPGRYFEHMWKRLNQLTDHREPLPVERRAENPGAWTSRVLHIAEIREGAAARTQAGR
jgi:sulfite reductase alpha subunit-like flavoprotein